MAGGAGDVARSVDAAGPVDHLATFVTAFADLVVAIDIVLGLLAERECRFWSFFFPCRLVYVSFAIAVAADTTRQTPVGAGAMAGLANTENRVAFILVMTLGALGVTVEYESVADLCFFFISLCDSGKSGKCKADYA